MSEVVDAALVNAGATPENLSDGQTRGAGAPAAPVIENRAPEKEPAKEPEKVEKEPAKEEPAAVEQEPTKQDDEPVVTDYIDMQDDNLNAVVDILKDSGLSPAEAEAYFGEAVEAQDASKINWQEVAKKVGGAKAHAIRALVEKHQATAAQDQAVNTALVADVHALYGGEAGFKTVAAWAQAKEKRDPKFAETLNDIRYDIQNGSPRAVKAAAKELLDLYNASPKTKGLGNGNLIKGEGKVAANNAPLSREAYLEAVRKAYEVGDAGEVSRLQARRMEGKRRGI